MSVPNTTTFTLQNVVTELGGGTSLSGCFALAHYSGFDPAYRGSMDSLLNFRNYNDSIAPTPEISIYPSTANNTGSGACAAFGTEQIYYHNGSSGSRPIFGNTIYTNIARTIVFNGNSKYYKARDGGTFYQLRINSSGQVISTPTNC